MTVEFKRKFLKGKLNQLISVKKLERPMKSQLVKFQTEIQARTQSGRGIEGQKFPELSESYKKQKIKAGRLPLADRTFSGLMLKSIQTRQVITDDHYFGRMFFSNSSYRKGSATVTQVARAMQKLAPFFGLSRIQREALFDTIRKHIGKT